MTLRYFCVFQEVGTKCAYNYVMLVFFRNWACLPPKNQKEEGNEKKGFYIG